VREKVAVEQVLAGRMKIPSVLTHCRIGAAQSA
jgi:hypothetical protein